MLAAPVAFLIAVAFEDGAQATFPFESSCVTSEIQMNLSYDDSAGPAVAAFPFDAR